MTRLNLLCKADQGSALIEFLLVTPVFLLLVFGSVDFGRAYFTYLGVADAAQAGAAFGAQFPTNTTGISSAATNATSLTGVTVKTVSYGCECSDGTSYSANCTTTPTCTLSSTKGNNPVDVVKVTTTTTYNTLVPWLVIPSSFTLTSTASMRAQ